MSDCVFCKIVAGQIPNLTIHEDDQVLAFLDINPLADGHTMVIPKAHAEKLEDLDDARVGALFRAVRAVSAAQRACLRADDTTIGINNGPAAGQVVPHVHVHVVPRWTDDGGGHIHSIMKGGKTMELERAQAKLREAF